MTSIPHLTSLRLILAMIAASCAAVALASDIECDANKNDALRTQSKEKHAKWSTLDGQAPLVIAHRGASAYFTSRTKIRYEGIASTSPHSDREWAARVVHSRSKESMPCSCPSRTNRVQAEDRRRRRAEAGDVVVARRGLQAERLVHRSQAIRQPSGRVDAVVEIRSHDSDG